MMEFQVADYGAIGDGETVNTEAIQKTIDVCHEAGGGRVLVADGDYVTGTIRLYSNIDFHIEANAVLSASSIGGDYPDFSCKEWDKTKAPRATSRCLIYVGFSENVSITGRPFPARGSNPGS